MFCSFLRVFSPICAALWDFLVSIGMIACLFATSLVLVELRACLLPNPTLPSDVLLADARVPPVFLEIPVIHFHTRLQCNHLDSKRCRVPRR